MKNYVKILSVSAFLLHSTGQAETATKITILPEESPLLSVAAGDWNGDKRIDSAVLIKSGDQADLYLYIRNAEGDMELKEYKKNAVWSGALAGTTPYLKVQDKDGLLLLYAENDAIGRNRWHQKLTLDYKETAFTVTTLSYDRVDTLNPEASLSCEVDFSRGLATKNKKPFKITAQKIQLSDWSDRLIPAICQE